MHNAAVRFWCLSADTRVGVGIRIQTKDTLIDLVGLFITGELFFITMFLIFCRLFMFNAVTSCTVMTSLQVMIFNRKVGHSTSKLKVGFCLYTESV